MSFLKTSAAVFLKLSPAVLQQNRTPGKFFKPRLFNLILRKNHTESNILYDTDDVQKYLRFLENKLSSPKIGQSKTVVLDLLTAKRKAEADLKCLEEMSCEGNKELKELIESDKKMLLDKIKSLKNEILNCIMPVDDENNRNVEIQVVGGIGGEEAKLFAKEVFNMYFNYVKYKNWDYIGSPDSGYLFVSGDNMYGKLKYEMGVHRVQRVPETEGGGRTHTSTCTVLVLPQPRSGEILFNEKDVIVETMRSSGPGGQNVNKTESCVRVTHVPTGIVIENQTSRFQYENKRIALERLRGVLFNKKQEEMRSKVKEIRKQYVATNTYSDKIRTYNFNQSRVTDHRLQLSVHNLRGYLSGEKELDRMVETVRKHFLLEELKLHIQITLNSEEYKNYENQCINVA